MSAQDPNKEDAKKTENDSVPFEKMNLQVGASLQLVTYGPPKKEAYSALIGYEKGRFLFIRMPQDNGFPIPLKNTERVEVRVFSGTTIYTFSSCVTHIYQTPQNFAELAFPDNIQAIPLRKDIRVAVKLPVRIWMINGKKIDPTKIALALDVSMGGIMLQSPEDIGVIGDELGVAFSLRNVVTEENILIEATGVIRNRRVEDDPTKTKSIFKHGLVFNELRPFHQSTLKNFINDYIIMDRKADFFT